MDSNKTIRIKGSDTMLYLTDLLAREYMRSNPSVSIYVDGGGTATGIKALGEGTIDICTASRPLKGEEVKIFADKYRSVGMSTIIAKDALSIYVNLKNPLKNISIEQVQKIFLCKTKNWSDLNWDNKKIIPVSRNPSSGTYLYFQEHILDGENYCEEILIKPTTESIVDFISENIYAIGYGGIGYLTDSVKALQINGIDPTNENVIEDVYPISRYLHFYTLRQPEGEVKKFIDWVISFEGQRLVRESGYVPIWIK
ncbi:MAG TPA: phosphate ABC transporter substrate-binding protein [Ignavibacteriaceae bacterium]|nr:phosphate ABC transporter substrate-binding protein [Ignavibacteriaceae bacterium]